MTDNQSADYTSPEEEMEMEQPLPPNQQALSSVNYLISLAGQLKDGVFTAAQERVFMQRALEGLKLPKEPTNKKRVNLQDALFLYMSNLPALLREEDIVFFNEMPFDSFQSINLFTSYAEVLKGKGGLLSGIAHTLLNDEKILTLDSEYDDRLKRVVKVFIEAVRAYYADNRVQPDEVLDHIVYYVAKGIVDKIGCGEFFEETFTQAGFDPKEFLLESVTTLPFIDPNYRAMEEMTRQDASLATLVALEHALKGE